MKINKSQGIEIGGYDCIIKSLGYYSPEDFSYRVFDKESNYKDSLIFAVKGMVFQDEMPVNIYTSAAGIYEGQALIPLGIKDINGGSSIMCYIVHCETIGCETDFVAVVPGCFNIELLLNTLTN